MLAGAAFTGGRTTPGRAAPDLKIDEVRRHGESQAVGHCRPVLLLLGLPEIVQQVGPSHLDLDGDPVVRPPEEHSQMRRCGSACVRISTFRASSVMTA